MIQKCLFQKRAPVPQSSLKTVIFDVFYDLFGDSNFLCLVFPPDVEPLINKVTKGMNAVFIVKFSSTIASNSFQWQHNEQNITGDHARMMNLTIANVTELHEGNYTCIVTFSSFEGSITSNRAQLLVCKLIIAKHDHIFLQ